MSNVSSLVPTANQMLGRPWTPPQNLTPPVPSSTLNNAYSLPDGTITDANRVQFAEISASAEVIFPTRIRPMTAPVILPTLKGTFFYDIEEGGSSQSFYAVPGAPNAPTTFDQMMSSMVQLGAVRSTLSQCKDNNKCANPFIFRAVRVDDQTTKRKGKLNTNPQIVLASYQSNVGSALARQIAYDNGDNDAAYKVIFTDSFGNAAQMYFHGVPVASLLQPINQATVVQGYAGRFPDVRQDYIKNMNNFCNAMRVLGLGLRYNTVQWTPMGLPVGVAPNEIASTGNGTPVAVNYAFAGTGTATYTFQMNPSLTVKLGKFRVVLREFKNLRVLNGRWPALGFQANGNYYVNVKVNAPNYLAWDGYGYLSPEIWSVFQPDPAPPAGPTGTSGVSGIILTSKRLGRPFGLQRGRQSNRVR